MKQSILLTLVGVGGLSVGAAGGYFVARHHFAKISEIEIEEVKERYRRVAANAQKPDLRDVAKEYVEERIEQKIDNLSDEELADTIAREAGYVPGDVDSKAEFLDDGSERDQIFVNGEPYPKSNIFVTEADELAFQRNAEKPYVISIRDFHDDEWDHHHHITLTYYAGDDTLIDETETIIPSIEEAVGVKNLTYFGNQSDDPDIVYIRKEADKSDFEIIRKSGSYQDVLLGVEPQE